MFHLGSIKLQTDPLVSNTVEPTRILIENATSGSKYCQMANDGIFMEETGASASGGVGLLTNPFGSIGAKCLGLISTGFVNCNNNNLFGVLKLTTLTTLANLITTPNTSIGFDGKNLTNIEQLDASIVTQKNNISTFCRVPTLLYNRRVGQNITGGTNVLAHSFTLPANSLPTNEDVLELTILGSTNPNASPTKSVMVSVNGSSNQTAFLTTGVEATFRIVLNIVRRDATTIDAIGTCIHSAAATTFGGGVITVGSFSSSGSIAIRTTTTSTGDIALRGVRLMYIPIQLQPT